MVKGNYLTPEEKRITYNLSFEDGFFELLENIGLGNTSTTNDAITKTVSGLSDNVLSIRDIAMALQARGYDNSKSSVYRILKK